MKIEERSMSIQITRPEVEALINRRLETGSFRDAEDVILQALKSSETQTQTNFENRKQAIDRLMAFGKKHGLTLGGMTIRQLRDEARP
jgi:Arc/MetJ-type ribon-helix-helix transcriptional regulator